MALNAYQPIVVIMAYSQLSYVELTENRSKAKNETLKIYFNNSI